MCNLKSQFFFPLLVFSCCPDPTMMPFSVGYVAVVLRSPRNRSVLHHHWQRHRRRLFDRSLALGVFFLCVYPQHFTILQEKRKKRESRRGRPKFRLPVLSDIDHRRRIDASISEVARSSGGGGGGGRRRIEWKEAISRFKRTENWQRIKGKPRNLNRTATNFFRGAS